MTQKACKNPGSETLFNWQLLKDNLIDSNTIKSIIKDFVMDCVEKLALIESALENQQWDQVYQLTHTLKGACATMAAAPMLSAAQHLEEAARQQDDQTCQTCLQQFHLLQEQAQSLVTNNHWPAVLD